MNRPPVTRWANTELPEPLARALASAEPARSNDDAAALSRMRERLQSSIGPTFDKHVPGHAAAHAIVLLKRSKWLVVSAAVSAGLAFFATRAALGPAPSVIASQPVPIAAPAVAAQELPAALPPAAAEPSLPTMPPGAAERRERKHPRQPGTTAQLGLAEELKGIENIRAQLETSPAKALAAAEAQQRVFAHGVLAPERELLRIEALLRLGRVSEAKARAARARGASGDQPYRDQIANLLRTAEH
jgi:hypothetical protein